MYAELQENPFEEEEDDIALSSHWGSINQYVAPLRDWFASGGQRQSSAKCAQKKASCRNQLLSEVSVAIVFHVVGTLVQ